MEEELIGAILQQVSLGYACHKLFESPNGHRDYIFLDVNPVFEKMTGLPKENIIGKGIRKCLDGTRISGFDWVGLYEKVAFSKQKQEFVQCLGALKRWYNITAFETEKRYFVTIFQDITPQRQAEAEREELCCEKELYRITLMSIGDGVVTTDHDGRIRMLNPAAQQITGWSEDEAKGKPFGEVFRLVSEETGENVEDPIASVLQTDNTNGLLNCAVLINREGHRIPITNTTAPIKNSKGHNFGAVMIFRDITHERVSQEKINDLNCYDSLTGLYSRHFVEQHIARLETSKVLSIAVITADVNGLKFVNDMFGIQEGDNLLKKAADLLRESCRKNDIVARWDGDEFIILLPHTTIRAAEKIAERIKNRCLQEKWGKIQLSLAIGYAAKKKHLDINQIIKEAEEMMYSTKLIDKRSCRSGIINGLLTTLFVKSMETEEHAERLKNYCLEIGKKMGLSIRELYELALVAVLHDIGKIGINENILQKPGPLTMEEWAEMKKHPEIGWSIAKGISQLVHIAEYILSHHERWDGKGYPRGLKGEEIPVICRILAVVDAYDAMTSDRIYRKAMSIESALAEIKRNSGTQFDPHVVEVFLNLFAKNNVKINHKTNIL
jgi:diguanylate cyclase (GGDEF)-like protein/PAS domain S-box-containing protein